MPIIRLFQSGFIYSLYIPYLETRLFNGTFCDIKSRALKAQQKKSDRFVAKIEEEERETNLEVFSLALQNGSLKKKNLLRRQTPVTAQRQRAALLLLLTRYAVVREACTPLYLLKSSFCMLQFVKVTGYKTTAVQ